MSTLRQKAAVLVALHMRPPAEAGSTLMLYELVNPSDKYTLEAPDLELAAVAVLLIGEGQYALQPRETDGTQVPLLFLGGADDWFKEYLHAPMDAVFTRVLADRRLEIAGVLDTVISGDPVAFLAGAPSICKNCAQWRHDGRCMNDCQAKGLDDGMVDRATREFLAYRAKWHDDHRSSMNDIGTYAWTMAARLRKTKAT